MTTLPAPTIELSPMAAIITAAVPIQTFFPIFRHASDGLQC